jgi:hypothetical protein
MAGAAVVALIAIARMLGSVGQAMPDTWSLYHLPSFFGKGGVDTIGM